MNIKKKQKQTNKHINKQQKTEEKKRGKKQNTHLSAFPPPKTPPAELRSVVALGDLAIIFLTSESKESLILKLSFALNEIVASISKLPPIILNHF
jgi:hypothetical protein